MQVCRSVLEDGLGLKEHTHILISRKELAARGAAILRLRMQKAISIMHIS